MEKCQVILALAFLFELLAIGIWDIVCLYYGLKDFTISSVVQDWSMTIPVVPMLTGLILGHLFWPRLR